MGQIQSLTQVIHLVDFALGLVAMVGLCTVAASTPRRAALSNTMGRNPLTVARAWVRDPAQQAVATARKLVTAMLLELLARPARSS